MLNLATILLPIDFSADNRLLELCAGNRLARRRYGYFDQCWDWFQDENQPGCGFAGIEQHTEPISWPYVSRLNITRVSTR